MSTAQARTTDDPNGGTKVQLTTSYDLGLDRQAWYFTAASEAPKVYIVNKNTTDRVLSCTTSDFAVGADKLQSLAVDAENVGTNEWTLTNEASTSGWYNITTVKTTTAADGNTTNTTFYISNHGGASNNMGFYNNATDPGSNFQFEEIDPTRSAAYNTLYNYFHNETQVAIDMTAETRALPAEVIKENRVGAYTNQNEISNYQEAYITAYYALELASNTDDQYRTFYTNLVNANEGLTTTNQLEVGAYYILHSVNSEAGYSAGAAIYANPDANKAYWHKQVAEVETTYTVDLDNGSANSTGTYWNTWTSTETPSVTFAASAANMETSSDNHLMMNSGSSGTSNYTLTAPSGYVIDSYSLRSP